MKTQQRILSVSLDLFNELGESNVTTVDIASEMNISPGNLYYHYRNKSDIIQHILDNYDKQLSRLLLAKHDLSGMVEHWLYLKLIVEHNWTYRFVYQDFENIQKLSYLSRKLNRIKVRMVQTMHCVLTALLPSDFESDFPHSDILAENMALVLTHSHLNCSRSARHQFIAPAAVHSHTTFQTLILIWPWLSEADRAILQDLRDQY